MFEICDWKQTDIGMGMVVMWGLQLAWTPDGMFVLFASSANQVKTFLYATFGAFGARISCRLTKSYRARVVETAHRVAMHVRAVHTFVTP